MKKEVENVEFITFGEIAWTGAEKMEKDQSLFCLI